MNIQMLGPLVVLVAWSMVVWVWMYATRLPAIFAMKMRLDPKAHRGEQMAQLPAHVRWKADNYNHLMEQPTIFYAIVMALVMMGDTSQLSLGMAWAYVGIKRAHSLVQATMNKIELRFLFSNVPMFGLTIKAMVRFWS